MTREISFFEFKAYSFKKNNRSDGMAGWVETKNKTARIHQTDEPEWGDNSSFVVEIEYLSCLSCSVGQTALTDNRDI